METRAPTFRRLLLPTALLGVFIVLGIIIWRSFGGPVPLEPQGYRVAMTMRDASDLYPGSAVTVAGVRVGDVTGIDVTPRGARATLEIEAEHAPLNAGVRAIRRTKSLLGEGYIELAPGPPGPTIRDGGEIPPEQVVPAQSLDEALRIFSPRTRRNLDRLFSGLAATLRGRSLDVSEVAARYEPVAENLTELFQTLQGNERDLERVFGASADVMDAVSRPQGELQAAITAGERVLGVTARRDRELQATVRAMPGFLAELERSATLLTDAAPDLDRALSALEPATPQVAPALRALFRAAPQFRGVFAELPAVIEAGERGLPSARRVLRAADSALRTVYPVSREAVPFVQLLSELRGSVGGFFSNIGQVANGQVRGPRGSSRTGFGGMPSLWNEAIAGWKKRLPTSRPNPYPRPGATTELAKGGLLSFDCRHERNTLYLPPFGAAPPCRLQGPWEFNGKSRYYPRLTLAPP